LITWESDCPLALIEFIPDSEDSNDAWYLSICWKH
jgi:hypothetical protein